MEQRPTPVRLTRFSLTAQAPAAVNATGNPEDATAADSVNGGSPSRRLGNGSNVRVWPARAIENVWVTSRAGR